MLNGRYDLIIFDKFEKLGKKTRYIPYRVGSAIYVKGNYTLFIPQGVSITGRVLMVPKQAAKSMTEIDLIEAYQAAADDYGID